MENIVRWLLIHLVTTTNKNSLPTPASNNMLYSLSAAIPWSFFFLPSK